MQPFEPGQIWTYITRPGEESSRIIICRVESDPKLGEVVHIHISGVKMKNRRAPGGSINLIGHLPFSAEALRENLSSLESSGNPLPQFEDGYKQWRIAFEAGKAGVWSIAVADSIAAVEAIMAKQAE